MATRMTGDIEIWSPIPDRFIVRFKSRNGKVVASTERYNSKNSAMKAINSMYHLLKEPRLVENISDNVNIVAQNYKEKE